MCSDINARAQSSERAAIWEMLFERVQFAPNRPSEAAVMKAKNIIDEALIAASPSSPITVAPELMRAAILAFIEEELK